MKKLLFGFLLPVFLLIFASGCVSVRYTPLGYQQYHPIDSGSVQVFMSAADVPGKFEKIGLLTASAQANTNDKSVINAMIDKAGENGADAIILGQFNNPDALTQVAGSLLHFTTLMKAQAVAIRFLDALGFLPTPMGRSKSKFIMAVRLISSIPLRAKATTSPYFFPTTPSRRNFCRARRGRGYC